MSDLGVRSEDQSTDVAASRQPAGEVAVAAGAAVDRTGVNTRVAGFLPPLGWLGVLLLVVGAVLIGAVLLNGSGTSDEGPAGGGSLAQVNSITGTDEVGTNALIGEVSVAETVAVFDEPQGQTLARASGGVYGLLDSRPGWVRLVFTGPDANGLYVTGWVQVSDAVVVTVG